MSVGLKISGISLVITGFMYYLVYQIMRLNYAFFKSHGFPEFVENPFYDYVIKETVENIPVVLSFHVFLFFIGVYVGWLILRPFRNLGEYCEQVLENPNHIYHIDEFSNYRLLTRFSDFFFEYLRDSRKRTYLPPHSIPPQYARIHKPVIDHIFMLHFGLLWLMIAISSSVFIIDNCSGIYQNMVELAGKTLVDQQTVSRYFAEQSFVVGEMVRMTIFFISLSYFLLGLHLYSKVSGAAFAIFSTMRSFMKGNYFSRVHLVGYSYMRDHTRRLNKYLDYIQVNLAKENPKG